MQSFGFQWFTQSLHWEFSGSEGHLESFLYFQWILAQYIAWVVWYSYDIEFIVAFWIDMPVIDNAKKYENLWYVNSHKECICRSS